MSAERVVHVRLLDVNDNMPKLVEDQTFICLNKPEPVLIKAKDGDDAPFSQPFTFILGTGKKSPNWELSQVDGRDQGQHASTTKRRNRRQILVFFLFLSYRFHS